MTAYKNFVQDFPNRCRDVLTTSRSHAQETDREVTLLLAVATPCLILPYERLHKDAHPSRDQERFIEAKRTLDAELEKECSNSRLWMSFHEDDWRFKKLDEIKGYPAGWGLEKNTRPIASKKGRTILKVIRNALAHGNIWTNGDPTHTVVFVSLANIEKPEGPFNTLQCSPQVLDRFIINWVDFLRYLEIPAYAFVETGFFSEEE